MRNLLELNRPICTKLSGGAIAVISRYDDDLQRGQMTIIDSDENVLFSVANIDFSKIDQGGERFDISACYDYYVGHYNTPIPFLCFFICDNPKGKYLNIFYLKANEDYKYPVLMTALGYDFEIPKASSKKLMRAFITDEASGNLYSYSLKTIWLVARKEPNPNDSTKMITRHYVNVYSFNIVGQLKPVSTHFNLEGEVLLPWEINDLDDIDFPSCEVNSVTAVRKRNSDSKKVEIYDLEFSVKGLKTENLQSITCYPQLDQFSSFLGSSRGPDNLIVQDFEDNPSALGIVRLSWNDKKYGPGGGNYIGESITSEKIISLDNNIPVNNLFYKMDNNNNLIRAYAQKKLEKNSYQVGLDVINLNTQDKPILNDTKEFDKTTLFRGDSYLLAENRDIVVINKKDGEYTAIHISVFSAQSNYMQKTEYNSKIDFNSQIIQRTTHLFAIAPNRDIYAIQPWQTASDKIEIYHLDSSQNYKVLHHYISPISYRSIQNFFSVLVDADNNLVFVLGRSDPAVIKPVKIYILDAKTNYSTLISPSSDEFYTASIPADGSYEYVINNQGDIFAIKNKDLGIKSAYVYQIKKNMLFQNIPKSQHIILDNLRENNSENSTTSTAITSTLLRNKHNLYRIKQTNNSLEIAVAHSASSPSPTGFSYSPPGFIKLLHTDRVSWPGNLADFQFIADPSNDNLLAMRISPDKVNANTKELNQTLSLEIYTFKSQNNFTFDSPFTTGFFNRLQSTNKPYIQFLINPVGDIFIVQASEVIENNFKLLIQVLDSKLNYSLFRSNELDIHIEDPQLSQAAGKKVALKFALNDISDIYINNLTVVYSYTSDGHNRYGSGILTIDLQSKKVISTYNSLEFPLFDQSWNFYSFNWTIASSGQLGIDLMAVHSYDDPVGTFDIYNYKKDLLTQFYEKNRWSFSLAELTELKNNLDFPKFPMSKFTYLLNDRGEICVIQKSQNTNPDKKMALSVLTNSDNVEWKIYHSTNINYDEIPWESAKNNPSELTACHMLFNDDGDLVVISKKQSVAQVTILSKKSDYQIPSLTAQIDLSKIETDHKITQFFMKGRNLLVVALNQAHQKSFFKFEQYEQQFSPYVQMEVWDAFARQHVRLFPNKLDDDQEIIVDVLIENENIIFESIIRKNNGGYHFFGYKLPVLSSDNIRWQDIFPVSWELNGLSAGSLYLFTKRSIFTHRKLYAINSDFNHGDASTIEIIPGNLNDPSYNSYQRKPLSLIDQRIEPTIEVTTSLIQNYRYAASESDPSTIGDHHNKIEPYDTYRTVIKVKTKNGLLPFQECNLSFPEPMTAIINGTQQEVDELEFSPVKTLSTGEIIIELNATNLTPPIIHLSIEHSESFKRAFFAISLFEDVNQKLLNASRDYNTLLNAKDHNNQPLISDNEVRKNTKALQSVCSTFQQTLGYVNKSSMGSTVIQKDSSSGKPVKRNILENTVAWRLDFDGEGVPQQFNLLNSQETDALFKRDSRSIIDDLKAGWDKFEEFVGDASLKVINIAMEIADGVENGIKIMVNFVIEGAKYVGQIIADGIEGLNYIFTAIEGIFQTIKVGIEKLINWLKEIFSWDDILRTKIMLKHIALESFEIMKGLANYATTQMIQSLDSFNNLAQDKIEGWINELSGTINSNVNDKFAGSTLAKKDYKVQNIVKDSYTSQVDRNGLAVPAISTDMTFNFDFTDAAGMADIETMITRAYRELTETDISDLITNPSKFFATLLKAVLRLLSGMINFGIHAIERLIQVITSLLNKAIDGIKNLLTAELNIPFVKDLYLYITSNESTLTSEKTGTFSLLDVLSLMGAIPVSVIYKATHDAKPMFISNESLDHAQKTISAKNILFSMGITTSDLAPRNVEDTVKNLQGAARYCSFIDSIVLGILTLVEPVADGGIDIVEYAASGTRMGSVLNNSPYLKNFLASSGAGLARELGILVFELIHLPLGFPYFALSEMAENKKLGRPNKPSQALAITNAAIDSVYSVLNMVAFYTAKKRFHLWESRNGAMIASIVGALQMGVNIAAFVASKNEAASSEDAILNDKIKTLHIWEFIKEISLSTTRTFKFLRSAQLLEKLIEEPPLVIAAIVSLQAVDVVGFGLATASSAYTGVLVQEIMDYIDKNSKEEHNTPAGLRREENTMTALPAPTVVMAPLVIARDSPFHHEAKNSKVKKHAVKIEEVTEERENTTDKTAKM